jgi:hypothetical protein
MNRVGVVFKKNSRNSLPGVPGPFYLRGGFCAGVPAVTGERGRPQMEPNFRKMRPEGLDAPSSDRALVLEKLRQEYLTLTANAPPSTADGLGGTLCANCQLGLSM